MASFKQRILTLLAATVLASGCAPLTSHNPLPHGFDELATVPGISENARFWGDEAPPWVEGWNTASKEKFLTEFGSIMGRNSFQRPREEALQLFSKLIDIYKGVIPFIILQLIGLLIVAKWPQLVIWLPAIAYGP